MDRQKTPTERKRLQISRKRKLRDDNSDDDEEKIRIGWKMSRLSCESPDRSPLESNFKREGVTTSPESEDGIQTIPSPREIPLKRIFQRNYLYLKRELDPDELVDQLSDFLDQREVERIRENHSRRRKVDLLLKTLVHSEDNCLRFQTKKKFFESLRKCKCEHICLKLNNTKSAEENVATAFDKEWCKYFLSRKEDDIYDNVDPLLFIDEILDSGGMDFHDHEDITNMIQRKQRVSALIELIRKKNEKAPLFLKPMLQEYKMLYTVKQEGSVKSKGSGKVSCSKVTTRKCLKFRSKGYALPNITVKAKFNFRIGNNETVLSAEDVSRKIKQIEFNAVKRGNKEQRTEMFDLMMESCRLKFKGLSISSVVVHIKAFTTGALQKAISACKKGTAVEWLFTLLTEDDLKVLKELNVDKVSVTLSMEKDQEDEISDYIDGTIQNLTLLDVKENWSYLLEELDAKIFVEHLNERDSADFLELVNCISKEKSREKRTTMLLRSLKTKQDLKWFEKHIKKKRHYIWKHITDSKLKSKDKSTYDLSHKIAEKYEHICEELEPVRLKGTPIADKVREFEAYLDFAIERKERVVSLLKRIFDHKDESLVQVFMKSLQEAGYDALTKEIYKVASIEGVAEPIDKMVLFAGVFDLSFNAEDTFKDAQKKEGKPDISSCEESGFASGSDALSSNSSKEDHPGSYASNVLWTKNWVEKHFMTGKEINRPLPPTTKLLFQKRLKNVKTESSTETVSFLSDNITSFGSVCSDSLSPKPSNFYTHDNEIKAKEKEDSK